MIENVKIHYFFYNDLFHAGSTYKISTEDFAADPDTTVVD